VDIAKEAAAAGEEGGGAGEGEMITVAPGSAARNAGAVPAAAGKILNWVGSSSTATVYRVKSTVPFGTRALSFS